MHKMEELGKEMVRHCGGLPLAVVVLGGILVTKENVNEWESVCKHVKAYLARGKVSSQEGEVEKILALSYNNLPHKLKPCFLYLSRFPAGSEIIAEKLYQLWIAEGMISMKDQIGDESMLKIAERYLAELAERSMVRVFISYIRGFRRFYSCRLHDLVRDLSLQKAKEENFFLFVHSQKDFIDGQIYNSSSSTGQIHRLVIHFHEDDVAKYVPPPKRETRHLRSLKLLVEGGRYKGRMPRTIKSQLRWLRILRVLELEGLRTHSLERQFGFTLDHLKLPDVVGDLVHLRYLSLRGSIFLWLPSSIGNLQHLQSFDLRDFQALWIPNVLCRMRELRYLYLPDVEDANVFGNFLGNKLRLDGLNKLEILEGFNYKWCSAKDLLKLTNLRRLQAKLFVKDDDIVEIVTFISNSKNMYDTDLHVKFPCGDLITEEKCYAVVTKLFSCENLLRLRMWNRINSFPEYEAGFALNLISLWLQDTELTEDSIETLEKLPSLGCLILQKRSFMGTEMKFCAIGFPKLKDLWLMHLPNLMKLSIAERAMPNLQLLDIWACDKLEMIPDGLRFITTLKQLNVRYMPEDFNRRLRVMTDGQEGEDFDKIRHVPLVKVLSG